MDQIIKKKIARNWFKTLQEILCQEIEELEGSSNLFKYKNWERGKNQMKVEVNSEFMKMEKYLTKLE